MSELGSRVAPLMSEFRHLRSKVRGPGCWLLQQPRAPWNWNKGEEERNIFLCTLLRGVQSAAFASAVSSSEEKLSWEITAADIALVRKHEECELGEWVLLLFASFPENPPLPPRLSGIKCGDLHEDRKQAGAEILILSLPDDREWIIAEQEQRF